MAYFLFVDESGIDRRESNYEVLAGISVHESRLWSLIAGIQRAEERCFGRRLTRGLLEFKGKRLLKKKTFRHAGTYPQMTLEERVGLIKELMRENERARSQGGRSRVGGRHFAALGQAKLAFCEDVFEIAGHHQVKTFASIVPKDAPRPSGDFLRKDYSYLFERFFHYLECVSQHDQGVVVFDELERSSCSILIDQLSKYFKETATGKYRASRVIPEPFFVHSELTTLIQVADLVAYIVNWGVRVGDMCLPHREELSDLSEMVKQLRFRTTVANENEEYTLWSFAIINDLRPRNEKS